MEFTGYIQRRKFVKTLMYAEVKELHTLMFLYFNVSFFLVCKLMVIYLGGFISPTLSPDISILLPKKTEPLKYEFC